MIALVGGTCTGKDTIRNELIKLGYKPVVTYTTRPKRDGEIDNITYHFVSDEAFEILKRQDCFAETTEYHVSSNDIWKYGTARIDLGEDKVIITNPDGLREFKKDKTLNVVAFLLYADAGTIWNRLRQRGDGNEEASRRIVADKVDFENINELVDFSFRTDGYLKSEDIAKLIELEYLCTKDK